MFNDEMQSDLKSSAYNGDINKLLQAYRDKLTAFMNDFKLESSIPINSEYWGLKNKLLAAIRYKTDNPVIEVPVQEVKTESPTTVTSTLVIPDSLKSETKSDSSVGTH